MDNLKELRVERGLTQADVARKVGVSLTAYLVWERGVGNPNEENMQKLKEVLALEG